MTQTKNGRSFESSPGPRVSRRRFLASTGAALGTPLLSTCGRTEDRPNLLWIIAEDFCPDLSCYGNSDVHTPNIDQLASQGVRYTNAYVSGPVCSASRSAIATGMYQTSIGAHHHRSHRQDAYRLPEGVRVFTHYFRQAGYHTSNVTAAAPGVRGTGKTDFNFSVEDPFDGTDWNDRRPGQPFYAQINFSETHRVFHPFPGRPIDPQQIHLPPYYPDHPAMRLDWAMYLETAQNLDVKVGKVLERLEEEGLAEDTIVFFFGDHGRPMPRGKQFLYEGGIHIPLIVRIPEKFRPPEFQRGSVRSEMVSAIDITTTSLKLAGIEPPGHMQGRIFIGAGVRPRDFIIAARDRCDETVDRIRCVRTKRFKYIRNFMPERPWTQPNVYKDTSYPSLRLLRNLHAQSKLTAEQARFLAPQRPEEELYDLDEDPHELDNLADSANHESTLLELRQRLEDWIEETSDQGQQPEGELPEEYDYRTCVEDWCTRFSKASKQNGSMRVVCEGERNDILRSVIRESGEFVLRFRARSKTISNLAFYSGTIKNMNRRAPDRTVKLNLETNGQWHEFSVPIQVEPDDFLALLAFDFGDAQGMIEFDYIRLIRESPRRRTEARWEFA